MKNKNYFLAALGLCLVFILAATSCAPVNSLRTAAVNPAAVTGTYTVFLYGARHVNDIETVAVLAKEGTHYTFEIYAPDFDYKIIKGMPAKEAIEKATKFVSFHHEFSYYRIGGILDPAGAVIGYEVRPYYRPIEFGYYDVMDISYTLADKRVVTRIHLKPEVEQYLQDGDRRRPLLFRR